MFIISKEFKKFIFKSVVFTAIFFILLTTLNQFYLERMLSQTAIQRSESQFLEYADETKILFLGDSHAHNGINPELIQNSFNYAIGGENYVQIYYRLKNILENNISDIETVFLPIDFHCFSTYRYENFRHDWYWRKYIDFKELSRNDDKINYLQKEIIARYPVIDNGGELINNLRKKPDLTRLVKGSSLLEGDFSKNTNKVQQAESRVRQQFGGQEMLEELLLNYLNKTIELAYNNNIKIYLIKYPVTREYYNEIIKIVKDEFYFNDKINSIAMKYDTVEILDYHDIYFDRMEFFYNSDHLNSVGANEFTKVIANDLIKPYEE